MKIRLKDVEHISATNIESKYNLISSLRDSIKTIKDSITGNIDTITFQYAKYKDDWLNFYQEQINGKIETKIETRDSIVIVQHWTPYKFLWFRFGKKENKETFVNYNPHSKVTLAVSIKLNK